MLCKHTIFYLCKKGDKNQYLEDYKKFNDVNF